jgi:hypothetical protein
MAYQYRGPGTSPRPPKHNWVNKTTRASRQRERMLDKSKENYFKYDMEDLLKRSPVPVEKRASIAATIFAKGSRTSVQEAKDYVKAKLEEGVFDDATFRHVMDMIDRYSTWR